MKEYCIDLKIAKELKENGFPQESNFYYRPMANNLYVCTYKNEDTIEICDYSAFTSDEILRELPGTIDIETNTPIKGFVLSITYDDREFMVNYGAYKIIHSKKLSNALAIMWICLKKEGYIK